MAIHLGTSVREDKSLECDVCIVGSGAGGSVLAERLATQGKRVVILEDGGFHPSKSFDLREKSMVPRLYQEGGGRATADAGMAIAQGRAVGGTTVVNWTTCFRTPERVFEYWAEHHGVDGITRDALVPHWERVEERIGVVKMRLDQVNRNNMVTYRGLEALGWHKDLLSRNVRNCAHTGYCGVGCAIDAKQSMLVTFLPDAIRAGAEIYANAWVEKVVHDGRKVTSVVARIRHPETDAITNTTLTVRAKVTVLAGGAINTPAILLRSELDSNGRTGARTCLHPAIGAIGVHEERTEPFIGSPQYVYSDQFASRDDGNMTFLIEGAPIFPMQTGGLFGVLGAERQAQMELMPHLSLTGALLHDGFDPDHRDDDAGTVSLKPNGQPKVDYPFTERLVEGMRTATKALMQIQLAGGAKQVWSLHPRYARSNAEIDSVLADAPFEPTKISVFVAHVMGGCAMGRDPATSVVDSRSLRHHEFDNLFVVDGSVYPTSVTVNPQLGIYGLASWASDHVAGAVS